MGIEFEAHYVKLCFRMYNIYKTGTVADFNRSGIRLY